MNIGSEKNQRVWEFCGCATILEFSIEQFIIRIVQSLSVCLCGTHPLMLES